MLGTHFYFDVGVKFTPSGLPVDRIRILLPFRTEKNGMWDLSDAMRHPDVSRLVFGEPVDVSSGGVLTYRDQQLHLISVTAENPPIVAGAHPRAESLWNLKLSPAPTQIQDYYARFRFLVRDPRPAWQWKRGLIFKRVGAKIDLRVSDVRETSSTLGTEELNILPIDDLYVFAIAPWSLQARAISPALKYMRVLEGTKWARYLESAIPPLPSTKMVVYYWRTGASSQENATPSRPTVTTTLSPFRAFLDLSHEYGPTVLLNQVLALIIVVIGVSIASDVLSGSVSGAKWLGTVAIELWPIVIGIAAFLGLSTIFGGVRRLNNWSSDITRRLDQAFGRIFSPK